MVNENLKLRLYRYKFIKQKIHDIVEWKENNENFLSDMWVRYCLQIKQIKFHKFCEDVYNKKLEMVAVSSYKHIIKKVF